ncbi:MAG: preprotein translocase subunit SecG [Alphaproteobacteria bacterium]|nr:preprotein translocase subunit SecG [Alphaproteobacteria bacterium]
MEIVVLVIHLFIALAMTGVILLQKSEGGALGIGGGGTAGGLFSARGAANALTRTTAYLAAAFFVTSIALTLLATAGSGRSSIIDSAAPAAPTAPAQSAPLDPTALPSSKPAPEAAPAQPAPAQPAPAQPAPAPAQPAPKPASP